MVSNDVDNKRTSRIVNGVFSLCVLIAGIIVSTCVGVLFKSLVAEFGSLGLGGYKFIIDSPVWIVGFAYIVPGVLGIIASATHNKGCYIANLVLCIIAMIVMVCFFGFGVFLMTVLLAQPNHLCNPYECAVIQHQYNMGVAALVFTFLGWFATLATSITCGILACSRQNTLYPGAVTYQNGAYPTTIAYPGPAYGPGTPYPPQAYNNYQPGTNAQMTTGDKQQPPSQPQISEEETTIRL